MKGFLLVDKGEGLTSFDVIARLRKATKVKRIGHAGTLDPLATGLMLVAIGEATKLLEYFVGFDKEYVVKARFGQISETYDREGKVTDVADISKVISTESAINKIIQKEFLGEISQVPPKYSAIKIGGKKAVDMVRRGQQVELKARQVRIDSFEIVEYKWPEVSFRVQCGSGTYIRSLIHDLGQSLSCGAYVLELRRTKVGDFTLHKGCCAIPGDNSRAVLFIDKQTDLPIKNIEQSLMSIEVATGNFKKIVVNASEYEDLKLGRVLLDKKIEQNVPTLAQHRDKVVAILENYKDGNSIKVRKLIL